MIPLLLCSLSPVALAQPLPGRAIAVAPDAGAVLEDAVDLWSVDPAAAVLYARIHRDRLPPDLLGRVQELQVLIDASAASREIDDRVNVAMGTLGGSTQPPTGTPVDPHAMRRILAESSISMGLTVVPDPEAADSAAAERCVLGQESGEVFLARIAPPETVSALAAATQMMKQQRAELGALGFPMPDVDQIFADAIRTFEALPRMLAVTYLPEESLQGVLDQL